ncbi:MAG: hypothetical protein V1797_11820 [Pseudomonadota bacterium]
MTCEDQQIKLDLIAESHHFIERAQQVMPAEPRYFMVTVNELMRSTSINYEVDIYQRANTLISHILSWSPTFFEGNLGIIKLCQIQGRKGDRDCYNSCDAQFSQISKRYPNNVVINYLWANYIFDCLPIDAPLKRSYLSELVEQYRLSMRGRDAKSSNIIYDEMLTKISTVTRDIQLIINVTPKNTYQWYRLGKLSGQIDEVNWQNWKSAIFTELANQGQSKNYLSFCNGLKETTQSSRSLEVMMACINIDSNDDIAWKYILELIFSVPIKPSMANQNIILDSGMKVHFKLANNNSFVKYLCLLGRYTEASKKLEESFAIGDHIGDTLFSLANCLFLAGHVSDAKSTILNALKKSPNSSLSWTLLGKIQAKNGNIVDATNSLNMAIALDKNNVDAVRTLRTLGIY